MMKAASVWQLRSTGLGLPNTRYLDLDGDLDLVRDPAQGGYTIEKGAMIPLISQALP